MIVYINNSIDRLDIIIYLDFYLIIDKQALST